MARPQQKRGCSIVFFFWFFFLLYTVNSSVVVYVQLCVGWEWDVHCVHCFCGKNKIKFYRVFVCSEYKNNILKYFTTHLCLYCL